MLVRDIMTTAVQTCQPSADLAAAAKLMWDYDCGFLPVVDAAGLVVGVITDRDICIACATRRLPPERIAVDQVMSRAVRACMPGDTLQAALATMTQFKVRRLPVITDRGALVGVVAMNDMVLAAERKGVPAKDVVAALAGICEHRTVVPAVA
jgi:CBS domain-containing protein